MQYIKELVELNDFIREMVGIIQQIYPTHRITSSLCDGILYIDEIRMEQVFSNLIGNAAKYSSKNSESHVICEKDDGGFATASIADQGIGMSSTTMDSIFKKFYRNQDVLKTHSGLGMGLFVASKIIADHGGKIWVNSEEVVDSTFWRPYRLTNLNIFIIIITS